MKLSIIIPVYNEKTTIKEIIKKISLIDIQKEIVIVDDCSSDGTVDILKDIESDDLKVFYHERNMGKGAAVRTAFKHITGDIIIIQDADLEYDPRDYPSLIRPIIEGRADVVYGSRFLGGPHRVLFFWHYVGNRIITTFSNMLSNLNLTDMETGYKVFRREIIQNLKLKSNRFGFEPEITMKVAKANCRIYEMPISYWGRDYAEGKNISWKDGIAAIFHIFRFRFFD
ncbi:MAG: glycosyl transferase [Syntrophobacterales bacterium CG_4_8_14_3_um_filter_49_14]|nr:MAG: glycosyl transferase [Syntrophobacterales bacterium CG_4_8_14_3_um_filter_49_14]